MESRSKILQKLASAKRGDAQLPQVETFNLRGMNAIQKFKDVLKGIGGAVIELKTLGGVNEYILQQYAAPSRIISAVNGVNAEKLDGKVSPQSFESVDLFIAAAHFGVAENGAIWITSANMGDRVLPFVCQHLAIVLESKNIVDTMHQAYELIGTANYEFGTFIAGPSKTADIEQSLVLGAHGPKTLTVFLLD